MSEKREGAKLVELLHLALLQVMPSYLPVSDYAVKGGANLRLFYGSRRRSQDIDLHYLGPRFHLVVDAGDADADRRDGRPIRKRRPAQINHAPDHGVRTSRRFRRDLPGSHRAPGAIAGPEDRPFEVRCAKIDAEVVGGR